MLVDYPRPLCHSLPTRLYTSTVYLLFRGATSLPGGYPPWLQ
ncbi:hypothetical protein QE320_gp011 [Pseudomonas phage EM]|uniref:Uncharacterized protein n=1 Tax=Pseudomonas phage EM TaxID=2936914 RepID=A0AAE9HFC4_9CAUD|nr:hypothetical protein QE320_gp011 [Pseudomonas phage EM]UPW35813.1 hypothetical protein EM_011 [Pseudomonas phage EM]